jgi:hypothetical protein
VRVYLLISTLTAEAGLDNRSLAEKMREVYGEMFFDVFLSEIFSGGDQGLSPLILKDGSYYTLYGKKLTPEEAKEHIMRNTAIANAQGQGGPNYTNRVGGLDYTGYVIDGTGYAAGLTAKETVKYGNRVKTAAQLTKENAAIWGKVTTRLNVAGGVIGVVDCGVQSYDDFSNGNYGLGAYEAAKAASYTTGTIMLFTPLAPIGAGILLGTGIVDIAGDIGLYIYGRNQ